MNTYIRVSIYGASPEKQDLLIALLEAGGFEGFEQPGEAEASPELHAFIPEKDLDTGWLENLSLVHAFQYQLDRIPGQNWNAVWESGFQPVRVEDFAGIRADFHPPMAGVQHEIVITPKMSFGTGHHATTYMMVAAMQQIDFGDTKVFDFGTGTGILAILAEKMGALSVHAIDYDEWSIANAAENLERNQCRRIRLDQADLVPESGDYDIILANINRNILLDNMSAMARCLDQAGILLLSGLLTEDETEMVQAAAACDLKLSGKLEKNNWICLRFNR